MDRLLLDIQGIQLKYQTSRLHGMSNNNDYINLGVYQWSFHTHQSFYNYDPLYNIKPSTLVLYRRSGPDLFVPRHRTHRVSVGCIDIRRRVVIRKPPRALVFDVCSVVSTVEHTPVSDNHEEFHTMVRVGNEFHWTLLRENDRQAFTRLTDDSLHRRRVMFFTSVIDVVAQNVVFVVLVQMLR